MPEWETDIRRALEIRARKAQPKGEVKDTRSPVRDIRDSSTDSHGKRFVVVSEEGGG